MNHKLLPLPDACHNIPGVWWRPTPKFIEELAGALQGRRVLEVFAGNGLLAGLMAARGVDIVATSQFASMDGHVFGIFYPVIELDAISAVHQLGADRDLLLMCWPTVTLAAFKAAQLWSQVCDRDILFIGEFTDYSKNHLGGTATDEFFDAFVTTCTLASYGSGIERACIGHFSSVS